MEQYHFEQRAPIDLCNVAEVELIYRNKQLAKDRPHINSSKAAYELLIGNWDVNKIELLEQFKIILLNRHHRCLGISHVATGGTSQCVVDTRIIFAMALKANATSIILAHNHPSGDLKPSYADNELTHQLIEAGRFLQIRVNDHLIVSSSEYLSMADEGMMFG